MKDKVGYLGLLGIPLAALGIVGSVAFAQTNVPQSVPAPVPVVQQTAPDTEIADKNEVSDQPDAQNEQADAADANDVPDTGAGDTETNDGPDTGN